MGNVNVVLAESKPLPNKDPGLSDVDRVVDTGTFRDDTLIADDRLEIAQCPRFSLENIVLPLCNLLGTVRRILGPMGYFEAFRCLSETSPPGLSSPKTCP